GQREVGSLPKPAALSRIPAEEFATHGLRSDPSLQGSVLPRSFHLGSQRRLPARRGELEPRPIRSFAEAARTDGARALEGHGPLDDGGQDEGTAGGEHGETLRARVLADDPRLGSQDDLHAMTPGWPARRESCILFPPNHQPRSGSTRGM